MNFPKLKNTPKKITDFCSFAGGLSQNSKEPYNSLLYTKNTVFTDEGIKTRGGLRIKNGTLSETDSTRENSFSLTDCVIFKNGEYNRLCVQFSALGSFTYRYNFKLISDSASVSNAGEIEIKESGGILRKPESVMCVTAKAFKGSGVFAFIKMQTSSSEGYCLEIYELSTDLNSWTQIDEKDMYVPTYLLNGLGNFHYRCEDNLPKPEYPESPNILNGICNCYFSSDGCSDAFYLPLTANSGLDEFIQVQLLADTQTTLEFTFNKNTFVSNTVKHGDNNVYLTYNGGFLQFHGSTGGYVPQRIYGRDNNLKVTIKHTSAEQFKKRVHMSFCGLYNLQGASQQLLLSGNKFYPELLLISASDNPLYFPENLEVCCGGKTEKITALTSISNKAVIFKENEMYSLSMSSNKASVKKISGSVGTLNAKTVKSNLKNIFFAGSNGYVYTLCENLSLKRLSEPIAKYMPFTLSADSFGALLGDNYTVFCSNKAFNLDLKRSDKDFKVPVWNIWEFPSGLECIDAFENRGRRNIICKTASEKLTKHYVADMQALTYDTYYKGRTDAESPVPISQLITVEVQTAVLNLGRRYCKKTLTTAVFYIFSDSAVTVTFSDEKSYITKTSDINISYEAKTPRSVKLHPLITSLGCGIHLTTYGDFSLCGIELEYYEMSE